MGTANVRKGFPQITVTDDGTASKVIEYVCLGFGSEEAVFTHLDGVVPIGGLGQRWRTESVTVRPDPRSRPSLGIGSEGDDPVVYFATVTQSLRDIDGLIPESTDRLSQRKTITQSVRPRMASVMGAWPSSLPIDPWYKSAEDIRVDIATGERVDINGSPQKESVFQKTLTITEIREGDYANFSTGTIPDHLGTRSETAGVFGYAAGSVLFRSLQVQQVRHGLVRWSYEFVQDEKNFLDMAPLIAPGAAVGYAATGETTTFREATTSPAVAEIKVQHFEAQWVQSLRSASWDLAALGLSNSYYSGILGGTASP